jgi:hypothetical protein
MARGKPRPDSRHRPRWFTPAAKVLKRVKVIPPEQHSRFPQNVKTAAPETQRVMVF